MENKRLIGVIVISWIEILIGLLGLIFFVISLNQLFLTMNYMNSTRPGAGEAAMGLLGIIPFFYFSVISSLFLFAGIGIGSLKPWGRKMNLIGIPVFTLLLTGLLFICKLFRVESNSLFLLFIMLGSVSLMIIIPIMFVFMLPIIIYLNRPKVKEQFK